MSARPWHLEADVLRLGTASTETVADGRRKFHEWIAKRLMSRVIPRRPAETTTCPPAEQIRRSPRLLGELLNLPGPGDDQVIVITDWSLNHYEELTENILLSIALCAAEFARDANRVCFIMLPQFPHNNHSVFWDPLIEMPVSGGTVFVCNNEGRLKQYGHMRSRADLGQTYEKMQRELIGTRQERFDDKIIRRMGHFDVSEEYCSRYFFDGGRVVQELSYLLVEQINQLVPRAYLARTEVIVPGDVDEWMGDAVTIACGKLKIRQMEWPMTSAHQRVPPPNQHTRYLVAQDFVSAGARYRRMVEEARAAEYALHDYAISAFVTKDYLDEEDLPRLFSIKRVSVDRVSRHDCVQCKLGLPFTEKYREELLGLRSYDAWEILSHAPWSAEAYGPPPFLRRKFQPDFVTLFEEFGDYLAYKLEEVLPYVVQGTAVAAVCPDEPAIQSIVKRMQPWADDRIVAVRIPRAALEESDRAGAANIRESSKAAEWARQLRHLSERNANVVLLDEFNGSNRTAHLMIRILAAFDIRPRAYIPIFNFVPNELLDGIRIVALYDVPSPRRSTHE
jgi:hypothetical protein